MERHNSKVFWFVATCCTSAALSLVTFFTEVGKTGNRKDWVIVAFVLILIVATVFYFKSEEEIRSMIVFPLGVLYSIGFGIIFDLVIKWLDNREEYQHLIYAGIAATFFGVMLIAYTALLRRRRRGGLLLLGIYVGVCTNYVNATLQKMGISYFLKFDMLKGYPKTLVCLGIALVIIGAELVYKQPAYTEFGEFLQTFAYVGTAFLATYFVTEGIAELWKLIYPLAMAITSFLTMVYYGFYAPEKPAQ